MAEDIAECWACDVRDECLRGVKFLSDDCYRLCGMQPPERDGDA